MMLPVYSAILILYTTYFCTLIQANDYTCDFVKPENVTIETFSNTYGRGSIRASSRDWYNYYNKDCNFILRPPPGDGIVLSIEQMNLYRYGSECVDSVTIGQYSYGKWNDWMEICDNSGRRNYMNDGPMRITFRTPREPGYTRTGKGFHIVYTAYYKSPCWKYDSFLCSTNNICISKGLVCNGVNNCGDGSDESFSECKRTWVIIGSVIGFFFIVMVVAGVICRRRRANGRSATETTPSPQTNPAYAQELSQMQTNPAYAEELSQMQTNPGYAEDALPSYDELEHSDPPKTPPDIEPPPYVNVEWLAAQQRPNNTQLHH